MQWSHSISSVCQ